MIEVFQYSSNGTKQVFLVERGELATQMRRREGQAGEAGRRPGDNFASAARVFEISYDELAVKTAAEYARTNQLNRG